jgi:ABC-type multidrug transport system fused ATPase/permease subunit
MNGSLLTVFVGLAALAIVIQMGVLIALFVSTRKASARLQRISNEMEEHLLPMIRDAKILLAESTPKVREILEDLTVLSATARHDVARISSTANEINNRVHEQMLRADQLVTRTLDRVEETTENVQHAISSPMRQISGVLTGVAAGLAEFLGSRKLQRHKNAMPRDEMFI